MRLGRADASWRISVGDRLMLAIALWLRDAAGMTPDLDPPIPPLAPAVPVRAGLAELAGPKAVAQWTGLWIGLWEGRLDDWFALRMLQPPGRELLTSSPELRALVEAGWDEAVRWAGRNRPFRSRSPTRPTANERLPEQVVRQLEKAAGRAARPFLLDIRILPISGPGYWVVAPCELVVSEELARDAARFRALLTDVLRDLV